MRTKTVQTDCGRWCRCATLVVIAGLVLVGAQAVFADDLSGASKLLCASVEATICSEDGECVVEIPWNLSIPQFIEVDLETRLLSTTAASGLNRVTTIEHLQRLDRMIVVHGFEKGRAFSWVINEQTGHVTAAIAMDGMAVSVFGACTPMEEGLREEEEGATP